MIDLTPIQDDVNQDKKLRRMCESCNTKLSRFLYILKSLLYGIFHLCEECKQDLDIEQMEGIQTTFVEKESYTWEALEEPIR